MKCSSRGYLFYLVVVLLGYSCAQIVAPQGGPRDTTPPSIVYTNFEDSMLHFEQSELILKFDEVIASDQGQALVDLSPLPREDLDVRAVHKTVTIKIPQGSLMQNTTYSLIIDGVKDITEGNRVNPRNYTFSTGAYLDSLSIQGKVIASESNRPDTSVRVYVYDAADSFGIIRAARPRYITQTAANGEFVVGALPPGKYRVYALSDLNKNYKYDLPTERIAFDTAVYELSDTTQVGGLQLYSWTLDHTATGGSTPASSTGRGGRGGSVSGGRTGQQITEGYSLSIDTATTEAQQDIYKPLRIYSTSPITSLDAGLISCTDTSAAQVLDIEVELDSTQNAVNIEPKEGWQADHVYRMFVKENALQDSSGRVSQRAVFYFSTYSEDDYSTLLIHFEPLDSSAQYVVHLQVGEDSLHYVLSDTLGFDIYSPHVYGSSAAMVYFHDLNRNGKYDNGDFELRRPPEIMQTASETFKIKKGWDHVYSYQVVKPGGASSGASSRASAASRAAENPRDNE